MLIGSKLFADDASSRAVRIVLVALFALLVALAGVFTMPPLDRDEARFAQATVQMLESGDFVAIRFQDDERNKKPPGIHWLQAASVSLFSSVEARAIWAYRLPSVLGAVLAALFTYAIGARLYGAQTGFLAALLLASAPGVAAEATIAKTDAMLLATVTLAQAALLHVFAAVVENKRARFWPFVFWFTLGAGVLIKGPIILMIVGLTMAALAFYRRNWDWVLALKPVAGSFILALMIAPWAFAIHGATEGRFFAEALGGDMLAKIGAAAESHGGPPGYHFILLFVLFWPAAALILPGLREAVETRTDWRSWFVLSWIVPGWIVFELTATKLPHYTLPLYPAVAIIAAQAAFGAAERFPKLRRFGAIGYGIAGMVVVGAMVALPIVFHQFNLLWIAIPLGAVLAFVTALCTMGYWRGLHVVRSARGSVLISALAAWALLFAILPNIDELRLSPRIATAIDDAGLHPLRDDAPPAVLSGYYEPSAVFLLGTETVLAKGAAAADAFAATGGAAAVEACERPAFLARLEEIGATARPFAEIAGLNYSNGDDVVLTLYAPRGDSR